MYKYEQIYDYFSDAITEGKLKPGNKLPSLRHVASQFSCAMSVCIQAFEALEYRGLVLAIEKSGFFVANAQPGSPPRPERDHFSFRFAKTRANTFTQRIVDASLQSDVANLGGAIPHASLLPQHKLQQQMNRVLRTQPNLWSRYAPPQGEPSLRREIAHLMLHKGVSVSPEEIIVTNGCMEALSLAIQSAVGPGGVIAVESPMFFGIIVLLEVLQVRVIEIPTTPTTGIDLDALESVLSSQSIDACMLSANFQNPLGAAMPSENKRRLLQMAEQYQFSIIEDDVFGECSFDGRPSVPIKKYDETRNVLFCSSFSKTICPSLRAGWLIAGKQLDNCLNLKLAQTLGSPVATQLVMTGFLESGGYVAHMRRFQKQIARQTFQLRDLVLRHFPRGTKVTAPRGGYFLWVEYEGDIDAVTLFERALQHKIVISPGPVFSVENRFHYAMRLSSAGPVDDRIASAVKQLGQWIR
ncbi:MAG: PLP-dependent aminotransferase family protein [Deltaproteobacteria bacterium]|nr:PLP-dependent aminotransferase family protein [Deltaproteobacteria bacterium]MBN2671335.1 PLP-dependent aminotransferase family protein [Deltaproteobacteria bacterium]